MSFKKGQNPNHPKKGSSTKADPIRDKNAIDRIKRNLIDQNNLRDYCLFTMGINTAWRANELLSIKVGHVRYLQEGDLLSLKQSKNKKYRSTPINGSAIKAIKFWLDIYGERVNDDAPLFPSKRSKNFRTVLTVGTVCNKVKQWCGQAGIYGHYGSHTLRKTWGYHQRITYNVSIALLMKAYGHSSERQTLEYLGIMPSEVMDLYRNEL